jgi:hypothetical protein
MSADGHPRRSSGGQPPTGESMGKFFALSATQAGRSIPIQIDYDKIVWSGLSWAVGEIDARDVTPGIALKIHFHSSEKDPITLKGTAYEVEY